jgi:uncharacterized protein (TIGR00296 family)
MGICLGTIFTGRSIQALARRGPLRGRARDKSAVKNVANYRGVPEILSYCRMSTGDLLHRCILYAFDVLHTHLSCGDTDASQPKLSSQSRRVVEEHKQAIFVSWYVKHPKLRGCLGCLSPMLPLPEAVAHFAVASAMQDRRFEPIRLPELPHASCQISLLDGFEPCLDIEDWTVGTHGIVVELAGLQATFLPHIPVERGWTRKHTIQEAVRKAGVPSSHRRSLEACKVIRYTTQTDQLHYDDWLAALKNCK